MMREGYLGIVVLGAVFLTVTGAEALYADLGHFGRRPIQWAWFTLVFPALSLNRLGQGALVLSHPEAISDPFYLMFPSWFLMRSEEHTSELQSLMRISYAVFCLKKKQ